MARTGPLPYAKAFPFTTIGGVQRQRRASCGFLISQPEAAASDTSIWRSVMGIGKADTVEEVARKVEQGVEIRNNYEVVFHLQQAVPEFLYMISANADLVMESKARWMPVARRLYGQKVVGTVPSSSSSARWARTCCTNGLRNTGARHQSTKNWSSAGCLRASRAWQPSWRVRCTSPISTAPCSEMP